MMSNSAPFHPEMCKFSNKNSFPKLCTACAAGCIQLEFQVSSSHYELLAALLGSLNLVPKFQ